MCKALSLLEMADPQDITITLPKAEFLRVVHALERQLGKNDSATKLFKRAWDEDEFYNGAFYGHQALSQARVHLGTPASDTAQLRSETPDRDAYAQEDEELTAASEAPDFYGRFHTHEANLEATVDVDVDEEEAEEEEDIFATQQPGSPELCALPAPAPATVPSFRPPLPRARRHKRRL